LKKIIRKNIKTRSKIQHEKNEEFRDKTTKNPT